MSIGVFFRVAAVLALLTGSCTSDRVAAPPNNNATQSTGIDTRREDERMGGASERARRNPADPAKGSEGLNERRGAEVRGGSSDDPSSAVVNVIDPRGDGETSGEDPDYADLLRARLEGRGRILRIGSRMAGLLPRRMPNHDTIMGIETRIDRGGDRYTITVEGDDTGWSAYVFHEGVRHDLARPAIRGDEVVVAVPWRAIGGKGAFGWEINSAWTATTLTATHYAFDAAPNRGPSRFPRP